MAEEEDTPISKKLYKSTEEDECMRGKELAWNMAQVEKDIYCPNRN